MFDQIDKIVAALKSPKVTYDQLENVESKLAVFQVDVDEALPEVKLNGDKIEFLKAEPQIPDGLLEVEDLLIKSFQKYQILHLIVDKQGMEAEIAIDADTRVSDLEDRVYTEMKQNGIRFSRKGFDLVLRN
mmetsp:Transcript_39569/g.60470  ORF Transcript_39569/g.60470 Transcript_39569/m.60470 type:complete len:131 (+) Transcript_39569:648-1040(+)